MKFRLLLLTMTGCVWISDTEYDARLGKDTGRIDTDCTLSTWFADSDGDGYGDPGAVIEACVLPSGYVSNSADCDDGDATRNPQTLWYLDGDGDGFGDGATTSASCDQPDGYVSDTTDCDDTVATTNPDASEDCATSADDDCDGLTDEPDALNCTVYFTDSDQDGYGVGDPSCGCTQPPDTTTEGGDCDDTDVGVNPGAAEVCSDGVDNDCDGSTAAECLLAAELSAESDAQGALLGVDTNDYAGLRLAVADDLMADGLATLMISNSREDAEGANDAGSLFLHTGPVTGASSLETSVQLRGSTPVGWFGYSPGAGDLDGDGQADAVVGAPIGVNGEAFVFFGPITANGRDTDADVSLLGEAENDRFGWSVSAGDIDDDGQDDVIIGAYSSDASSGNAGAAYLLRGPLSSTTSRSDADVLLGVSAGDRAGIAATIAGDVDGDGINDLLVGASRATDTADEAGAVYVVRGPVSITSLADAALILRGASAGAKLGESLSAAGDLDGDGLDDMLLGAPESSSTYVVRWSGGGDELVHKVADATLIGASGSGLGRSLVTAGDIDGDGAQDIAVGAPAAGIGGQAWLMYGPLSGIITSGDVTISTTAQDATFGYGLAAPGDVNGDAAPDLFIGAGNDSAAAPQAGAVWLLLGSGL